MDICAFIENMTAGFLSCDKDNHAFAFIANNAVGFYNVAHFRTITCIKLSCVTEKSSP